MPENNPLHLDMRVREYLRFRARLKGLGWRRSRERVDIVMEQCGVTAVHRRIIGQLSKGFRQRVGLADALVHSPDLIILDEPTIGLDPHQIRTVRALIKQFGAATTILLSTHILTEVEMTCSRVIILNHGRILAADTTENLEKHLSLGGAGDCGDFGAAGRIGGVLAGCSRGRALRYRAVRWRLASGVIHPAERRGFAAGGLHRSGRRAGNYGS